MSEADDRAADAAPLTRKFQKELNGGIVSLLALALVAAARQPVHGYALARRLEQEAGGEPRLAPGTVYPVLRGLEAAGLLASTPLESHQGPPRRGYLATAAGRAELARWNRAWERTRTLVERVLDEGRSHA